MSRLEERVAVGSLLQVRQETGCDRVKLGDQLCDGLSANLRLHFRDQRRIRAGRCQGCEREDRPQGLPAHLRRLLGQRRGAGVDLAIDSSTDPPTYSLAGSTLWSGTYCTGITTGAGGVRVGDPATSLAVAGSVAVGPDPKTQAQTLMVGSNATAPTGSSAWNFTED